MQHTHRQRSSWLARSGVRAALKGAALATWLGGALAAGCGGTSTNRSGLALGCTVNSDCDANLVCTFGRCHAACKVSTDCDSGARCVESSGVGVCQLQTESQCVRTSDCPTPLKCAVDSTCRNECASQRDCLSGQVCSTSGSCADPAELGTTGDLMGTSTGGASGAGGGSGTIDGKGGTSMGSLDGGPFQNGSGGSPLPPGMGGGANFGGMGGCGTAASDGTKCAPPGAGGMPNPGCGNSGQPCCGPTPTCTEPGTFCNGSFTCVACGAASQQCCPGDTCTATGTTCSGGSCVACGGQSQPCCGTTACTGSLACTTAGVCDVPCSAPYVPMGGVCVALAPRPLSPLSGSNVATRSPKLSWALPAGIPTAHVDVCKDRGCTNVLFSSDVTGSNVVVGTALPPGTAFWKLHAADAQGTVSSAVWEIQIGGNHDAPLSSPWGVVPDFNGDGLADVVMAAGSGASAGTRVYSGSTAGVPTTFATLSAGPGGGGAAGGGAGFTVCDFDGDGYTDLVPPSYGNVSVYRGGSAGISITASQSFNLTNPSPMASQAAGDVSGDGYGDLVIPSQVTDTNNNTFLALTMYPGGSSGLSIIPQSFTTGIPANQVVAASDTSDLNGDGFADVTVIVQFNGTLSSNVFYGSAGGLSQSPTTFPLSIGGGGGGNMMLLSSAGDVNGDGYDDMLLGGGSSAGLYPGSATGLSATSTATIPVNTQFGGAFAKGMAMQLGLGDANGDGYSDIVVPATSPTLTVYLGSATGLQTGAGVTLTPTAPPSFIVSSANIEALSALGDVNGDGLSDLGFEVDWTSQAQLQNHQAYIFVGGAPVPTGPAAVQPLIVSAIR